MSLSRSFLPAVFVATLCLLFVQEHMASSASTDTQAHLAEHQQRNTPMPLKKQKLAETSTRQESLHLRQHEVGATVTLYAYVGCNSNDVIMKKGCPGWSYVYAGHAGITFSHAFSCPGHVQPISPNEVYSFIPKPATNLQKFEELEKNIGVGVKVPAVVRETSNLFRVHGFSGCDGVGGTTAAAHNMKVVKHVYHYGDADFKGIQKRFCDDLGHSATDPNYLRYGFPDGGSKGWNQPGRNGFFNCLTWVLNIGINLPDQMRNGFMWLAIEDDRTRFWSDLDIGEAYGFLATRQARSLMCKKDSTIYMDQTYYKK